MASRATAFRSTIPGERREDARFAAQVTRATVRGHAQEPAEATLLDISLYGCRLTCAADHDDAEPVWLRLNGSLPIAAQVVWSRGGTIGCRFDAPIERSLLRSLTITAV